VWNGLPDLDGRDDVGERTAFMIQIPVDDFERLMAAEKALEELEELLANASPIQVARCYGFKVKEGKAQTYFKVYGQFGDTLGQTIARACKFAKHSQEAF
jgi:hypothetical protein